MAQAQKAAESEAPKGKAPSGTDKLAAAAKPAGKGR